MMWDAPEEAKHWIWEVMPYANVVKAADEEWEFITDTPELEKGSERILETGVELVIVTLGEHGCYYNNGSHQGYVDGFKVEVGRSTRCGRRIRRSDADTNNGFLWMMWVNCLNSMITNSKR